jgi:D-serine deaminase-like pyridoxal phosphate-dependent protein
MPDTTDDKAPTPRLLLDVERMERNLETLKAHVDALGVAMRPHVKTCKSVDVARRMVTGDAAGITVSTLAEAAHFLDAGFADQIYAVGIAPGKLPAVADLMRRGAALKIALDGAAAARAVVESAGRLAQSFDVVLEIDSDGKRAGLAPDDAELVEAARVLDAGGCRVVGVMTHMGGSYACRDADCLTRAAEWERRSAVAAATRLREAGFPTPIVSVGSTPTARFAADLDGVTEVRAGTHVFMDLVMCGLGVCDVDDIAISVQAEVIGYRQRAGEWLVDAGWMALSRDRGTASQAIDFGYGLVCDERGRALDDVIVRSADQEHGIVAHRDGRPLGRDAFRIGQRVRILPNHACATAAQFDGYHAVGGAAGSAWWPRIRGW